MAFFDEFIQHLVLQREQEDVFLGESRYAAAPNHIYGGQVMAQALSAASQTVAERDCHNLTVQFLRGGSPAQPVVFTVHRSKDGRSFSNRRVVATQGDRELLSLEASFQVAARGIERQERVDVGAGPDGLVDMEAYRPDFEATGRLGLYDFLVTNNILEFRCEEKPSYIETVDRPPIQKTWVRSKYSLPSEQWLQRVILAYISDHNFLRTASLPYRSQMDHKRFQLASLNHAMWIHRPVDLNQWLLFDVVSPSAWGQRSQALGHFYTGSGELVATALQEGLLREVDASTGAAFSENV